MKLLATLLVLLLGTAPMLSLPTPVQEMPLNPYALLPRATVRINNVAITMTTTFMGFQPLLRTTLQSPSCSQADITATIAMAVTGDEVTVPTGTCTYTTQLAISKHITLRGGVGGTTTLIDNIPKDGADASVMIFWTVNGNDPVRLTSFSLQGLTTDPNLYNKGHVAFAGAGNSVRFDNNTITNPTTTFMRIEGCIYGVADHNNFLGAKLFVEVFHGSCNSDSGGWGDGVWANAFSYGTAEAFFIEDNTLGRPETVPRVDGVTDMFKGSKTVLRFNTLNQTTIGSHGTETGGRFRSMRYCEIYGNRFNYLVDSSVDNNIWIRGGTCMVFANTVIGTNTGYAWNKFVNLSYLRDLNTYVPWGMCNGTSPYDENTTGMTGYRCVDQPGAGTSNLISGDPPSPSAWVGNALNPVYIFANSLPMLPAFGVASGSTHITENRDFYVSTGTFNGTVGVGVGINAVRPTTCTTGVMWWSTDLGSWNAGSNSNYTGQGVGSLCTATNTWTNNSYTPYTYPHPLTSTGASLVSVTPASGTQGASLPTVVATGSNTTWVNGVTTASFSGTGIAVNSTTVTSATSATINLSIGATATVGARNVTMTTGGSAVTLTNGFTVNAQTPAASKLGFTVQPASPVNAGATFTTNPRVAVQLPDGTTDTSSSAAITISLCSGTGTLNGTLTRSASAGVAIFTGLSVTTVAGGASYRICAASGSLTPATSNTFTVNVPTSTPTKLGFTSQPTATINSGGNVGTVRVAIQFADSSTDTSSTASVFIGLCAGSPSGTIGGTQTVSAVAGVATFSDITVTSTNGGSGFSLCATSSGLTSAVSSSFTVNVPANQCTTSPLTITNVRWPTAPSGSRVLGWNSGGFSIASVRFTYPNVALFTDTRGCQYTAIKP